MYVRVASLGEDCIVMMIIIQQRRVNECHNHLPEMIFIKNTLPLSLSLSVTVRVGFESVVYSQRESRGAIEVCVEVASPAVAERQFFLLISSSNRDAGTASTLYHHCC